MSSCGFEFQPIILAAGRGSRMNNLLSGKPKCLVTVANKPIIQYSLEFLIKNNINDAMLIVLDNEEELIKTAINRLGLNIHLEYVTIKHGVDYATADTLRMIKDRIKKDVLLLSCDLLTEIDLSGMIEQYRLKNASFMCLLARNRPPTKEQIVPANKFDMNKEFEYIGLSCDDPSNLVLFEPDIQLTSTMTESLPLKRSLLKCCPSFNLHIDLMDAHLYIFRRWILDYLNYKSNIRSIKLDLLPSLVRKQFRPRKQSNITQYELDQSAQVNKNIYDFMETPELQDYLDQIEIANIKNNNQQPGHESQTKNHSPIKCAAYVFDGTQGFCIRVNNLQTFCQANRILQASNTGRLHPETCTVGEKSIIKRTVMGQNCRIGQQVQLTNCILQDNVTIGDNCHLVNTVVCQDVVIGNEVNMENCLVGTGQKVNPQTRYQNESIMEEIFDF